MAQQNIIYEDQLPCVGCGSSVPVSLTVELLHGEKKDVAARMGREWELTLAKLSETGVRCDDCHSQEV